MATKVEQLRTLAQTIKNEKEIGGNTADRIGSAFEGVADAIEGVEQIQSMDDAVAEVQAKVDASIAEIQEAVDENKSTIQSLVDALPVTQTTGDSETSVMSQKAVTEELATINAELSLNTLKSELLVDNGKANNMTRSNYYIDTDNGLVTSVQGVLYDKDGNNLSVNLSLDGTASLVKNGAFYYDKYTKTLYYVAINNGLVLYKNEGLKTENNKSSGVLTVFESLSDKLTEDIYANASHVRLCKYSSTIYGMTIKNYTGVGFFKVTSSGLLSLGSIEQTFADNVIGDILVNENGTYIIMKYQNNSYYSLMSVSEDYSTLTEIGDSFIYTSTSQVANKYLTLLDYGGKFFYLASRSIYPLYYSSQYDRTNIAYIDMSDFIPSLADTKSDEYGSMWLNSFVQDKWEDSVVISFNHAAEKTATNNSYTDAYKINLKSILRLLSGEIVSGLRNVQSIGDLKFGETGIMSSRGETVLYTRQNAINNKGGNTYLNFGLKDKCLLTRTSLASPLYRIISRGYCQHHSYVFKANTEENPFGSAAFRIVSIQKENGVLFAGASARLTGTSDGSDAETVMAISYDNGETWESHNVAMTKGEHNNCSDGMIAVDNATEKKGRIWTIGFWWDGDDSHAHTDVGVLSSYSDDNGGTWSSPEDIGEACKADFEASLTGTFLHVRPAATSAINYVGKLCIPLEVFYTDSDSKLHNAFGLYVTEDGETFKLTDVQDSSVTNSGVLDFPEASLCQNNGVLYASVRSNQSGGRRFFKLNGIGNGWQKIEATNPDDNDGIISCGFGCFNGVFVLSTPTTVSRANHTLFATRDFKNWSKIKEFWTESQFSDTSLGYSQLVFDGDALKVLLEDKEANITFVDLDYLIPLVMGVQ